MKRHPISLAAKRTLDLSLSTVDLLVLAVPPLFAALAIKLEDRGPVFFLQERVGKGGRPFRVWKFRTMISCAIRQGLVVTVAWDDARIIRLGKLLRSHGLDELPKLFNVLAGEMNLVGPRSTLPYQVMHYDGLQRRRLETRPGITSLAVVSGRNALSWLERIRLDVWCIDHWTSWLDMKILFSTLRCVLVTREGLYGKNGINYPFVESLGRDEGTEGEA